MKDFQTIDILLVRYRKQRGHCLCSLILKGWNELPYRIEIVLGTFILNCDTEFIINYKNSLTFFRTISSHAPEHETRMEELSTLKQGG